MTVVSDSMVDSEWNRRRNVKEAAKALCGWARQSIIENAYRANRAYRFASLFEGYRLTALSSFGISFDSKLFPELDRPMVRNKCRRLTLTVMNKLFANDSPQPAFMTKGGDWEQRLRAEYLGDVVTTEFDEEVNDDFGDLHELNRHGGTFATSAVGSYGIFAFPGHGKVDYQLDDTLTIGRVLEHRYGATHALCRTVWMDPEALVRRYPKKATAIRASIEHVQVPIESGSGLIVPSSQQQQIMDRKVAMVQGWTGKSGETMGRFLFCLRNGEVLAHGPWRRPTAPGRFWHFERATDGMWGTPLTQILYESQIRQNRIIDDADDSERNTPQLIVGVRRNSADPKAGAPSVKAQLLSARGTHVVETDQNPKDAMEVWENPKFNRQSMELEERYDRWMHEDSAISQSQSSSTGQPGTQSGIQEQWRASLFTENFADQERRIIKFRAVTQAILTVWAIEDMIASGQEYSKWIGDEQLGMEIKAVDLEDALEVDKYVLSIKPVSEVVNSPQALMDKGEKMLKAGFLEPANYFASLEKTYDLVNATGDTYAIRDWVDLQMKRWLKSPRRMMVEASFYQSPEKWMGLEALKAALKQVAVGFLKARQERAPQERLRWFERFCNETIYLIQQEERRLAELAGQVKPAPLGAPGVPPPMPLPAGPMGPPPGMPGLPPMPPGPPGMPPPMPMNGAPILQ